MLAMQKWTKNKGLRALITVVKKILVSFTKYSGSVFDVGQ